MNNPPGVPPLLDSGVTWDDVKAVEADGPNLTDVLAPFGWGIFDQDGNEVIVGDSTVAFEFVRDFVVATYPVEGGDFASYNKVQTPFRLKFTFTKGGTISERDAFLNSVEAAQNSLDLFVGLTPEITYRNITIDHYDLRRTSRNGVTLLTVDVWCEEVRTAPALQFSNSADPNAPAPITSAQNPGSQNAVDGGTVQAETPVQQSSSDAPTTTGAITSALSAPDTITSPGVSLTNSQGNIVPPNTVSPIRSQVTFTTPSGPASGIVLGVVTGAVGQTTNYGLQNGITVPVNEVIRIHPPGFTVVQ